jgi:2',3'-cyclic-nucleotide 2'-phosphodiesterase (5'-nucleotidase family)
LTDLSTVTLLYTANLRGDLALLPRLFTMIQHERRASEGLVLLLDLGDTCSVESWVCQATQGRAPFLVLDGMGYDAVLIGGPEKVPIPPPSLRMVAASMVMAVVVWNRARPLTRRGITVTIAPGAAPLPDRSPAIRVDRSTQALPDAHDPVVTLGDVAHGHLARVDLAWPEWTVQAARLLAVSPDVPADPTIAALVEFVESEARHYAQNRQEDPPT